MQMPKNGCFSEGDLFCMGASSLRIDIGLYQNADRISPQLFDIIFYLANFVVIWTSPSPPLTPTFANWQ